MDVSEYISGEKLQELTDFTIVVDNKKGNKLAMAQLPNTNCKYEILYSTDNISDNILNAKSLFVYTHALPTFFNEIFPKLKNPIILMSHNSDTCVYDNRYDQFLNSNKLIKWFAQNCNYKHEKLIPIPIGIANSQWEHGNMNLINEIRDQNNNKTSLIYNNFNVSTSPENRYYVQMILERNGIPKNFPSDNKTFLTDLSKSRFCICPFGAGYDSHRVWESLYLRTIPVVPDCYMFRSFNLPMIFVNDWNNITLNYLENEYNKISEKTYSFEKLKLSYWKEQIKLCMV